MSGEAPPEYKVTDRCQEKPFKSVDSPTMISSHADGVRLPVVEDGYWLYTGLLVVKTEWTGDSNCSAG